MGDGGKQLCCCCCSLSLRDALSAPEEGDGGRMEMGEGMVKLPPRLCAAQGEVGSPSPGCCVYAKAPLE